MIKPSEIAPAMVSDLAIFQMAGNAAAWEPREMYIAMPSPGAPFGALVMIADRRLSCALHLLHSARSIVNSRARSAAFAALRTVVLSTVDLIQRGDTRLDGNEGLADSVNAFFDPILRTEDGYASKRESDGVAEIVRNPRVRSYRPLAVLSESLLLNDRANKGASEPLFPIFDTLLGASGDLADKIKNDTAKALKVNESDPIEARIRREGLGRFVQAAYILLAKEAKTHLPATTAYDDHVGSAGTIPGTRRVA
jgi:hypothetical protein